ncbi:AAA family ATPase, partial [Paenibacillus elgii]
KIDTNKSYRIDDVSPSNRFLQYLVNLKAEKAFAKDENDNQYAQNIEEWFNQFESCLREVLERPQLSLNFNYREYQFLIHEPNKEPFELTELSDGYTAILNILSDLIIRMEWRRTKNYNVQGIVLIDEPETHLHISLQKKILPFLTRFFPNVQFIVATHSPFVINSLSNAVVYDLETKLHLTDPSAYSYESIVENYFNVDMYSKEAKEKLGRYIDLAQRSSLTEEEEIEIYDLRNYLKHIPDDFGKEIKLKYTQFELQRKSDPR